MRAVIVVAVLLLTSIISPKAEASTFKLRMSGQMNMYSFEDSNGNDADSAVVDGLDVAFFVDSFTITATSKSITLNEGGGVKSACRNTTGNTLRCQRSYYQDFDNGDGTTSTCRIKITRLIGFPKKNKSSAAYGEAWSCDDGYTRSSIFSGSMRVKITQIRSLVAKRKRLVKVV